MGATEVSPGVPGARFVRRVEASLREGAERPKPQGWVRLIKFPSAVGAAHFYTISGMRQLHNPALNGPPHFVGIFRSFSVNCWRWQLSRFFS